MNRRFFRIVASLPIFFFLILVFWTFSMEAGSESPGRFRLVTTWGTTGQAPGQFHEPMGLASDPQGNLYVADTRNARIQKLTSDGSFLLAWGQPGEGPGEFSKPVDVAVDGRSSPRAVRPSRYTTLYLCQIWGMPDRRAVGLMLGTAPQVPSLIYLYTFCLRCSCQLQAFGHQHRLSVIGNPVPCTLTSQEDRGACFGPRVLAFLAALVACSPHQIQIHASSVTPRPTPTSRGRTS